MNVQKGKVSHSTNSISQQSAGHYPNQQQVGSTPFHNHSFDGDASQKYDYRSSYVGAGVPVGQVPARLPLATPLTGPNPPIANPPTGPNSVGGMPQGPPPGSFVGHGPLDLSKQTPPIHQPAHHPLPPGGLAAPQQIPMANTGHGPMQGRPAQGNNQFGNRYQLRGGPGSHLPRPSMPGQSINPNHPPNTPTMPYPNANQGLNQQVLFVIGPEGFNGQPYLPYIPPGSFYPPGGTMPPANVAFNPPRAAQQQQYGFRTPAPYQYPIQSSPGKSVYYQTQQQQQQQQQQPQQQQQQQQPQQAQQPQVAVPPSVVAAVAGAAPSQPRDSSASQGRRQRSSALRIVDPNTNRDVLTGEEVPPTAATPPTVAAPAEETPNPANGSLPAAPLPAMPVPSAVTAPTTAPILASTAPAVTVMEQQVVEAAVEAIEEKVAVADAVEPVAPVVEASVTSSIPAVEEAAPVDVEEAVVTAAVVDVAEEKVKESVAPIAPVAPKTMQPPPAPVAVEKEPVAAIGRENGELPNNNEPLSISTALVSTPTSPETEGKVAPKRKGRKSSRPGSTPTPPAVEEAISAVAAAAASVQSPPLADSRDDGREKVGPSEKEVEKEVKVAAQQEAAVPVVQQESMVETSTKEDALVAAVEAAIVNGDEPASVATPAETPESENTPPSAVADDGDAQTQSKASVLRYRYKDDQWSPVNPEGKKAYDRTFLLELQNNPASQKKPEGLPNLEVVRDKQQSSSSKRLDFTPPFLKLAPGKGGGVFTKQRSQQGNQRGGGDQGPNVNQQPQRRVIEIRSSIARMERVEDTNVWKPRHAAKSKEDDSEKIKTDEMLKNVRGILNKLTPSKFDKLLTRIQSLNIDTEDRLAGVIKLFFEKAVDEPIFSSTYAKMCQALSIKEVASSANPTEMTNFRKLLLTRCQREFEKDSEGLLEVENKKKGVETAEADKKKELEDQLEELINKNRRRSLGNIRFIGELFKLRILSVKIMHQCIVRLLREYDEESLECLCRLLSTIGKELETPMQPAGGQPARSASISQNRDTMNSYFGQLESIVKQRKTSNRIRFMIQDVVDLRACHWKPRREDNNPKTIEQIHRDAERERDEQEKELMNAPAFQGGNMGQSSRDRPGDRRDRDDRDRKRSQRVGEDGWNTVSGSRTNTKMDMKQLRIPRLAGNSDTDQLAPVTLGPSGRGMSWGRGASGGMSANQSAIAPSEGSGSVVGNRSNRYQLLDDDSGSHGSGSENKAPFLGRSSLGGPPTSGRAQQEYRPMSGATKSAFFPPKDSDRERALDAVRSHNSGPIGRSRSQQSSRESSVTRPVREVPQPLREAPKAEPLLGKSTATIDEIERKTHSVLGEFFINEKIEDAIIDLKESLHSTNVSKFINFSVMHVLENDRVQRKATGSIFKELVKRRLCSTDDVLEGFSEVLQSAEDFLVDIPKLWEYLAEMIEPVFADGVAPFTFLGSLSSSVNSTLIVDFIAAALKESVRSQGGEAAVGRLWSASNVQLATLIPGVDPVAFAEKHKLKFLLESQPGSSGADKSTGNGSAGGSSSQTQASFADFQIKLEKYLKSAPHTTEEVCTWIQQNTKENNSPAFIRALITAVTESCIDGIGTDSKLNVAGMKHLAEVLRKYVDNGADLELHSLFAVQALVTHRQHPKGLIQGIFDVLYDNNVVSEDGFETWVNTDDPSEREGKAVALKSLTSFLTWLKEADPESDQEADG